MGCSPLSYWLREIVFRVSPSGRCLRAKEVQRVLQVQRVQQGWCGAYLFYAPLRNLEPVNLNPEPVAPATRLEHKETHLFFICSSSGNPLRTPMESKVSMMDWLTLPRFLRSSFEVKG